MLPVGYICRLIISLALLCFQHLMTFTTRRTFSASLSLSLSLLACLFLYCVDDSAAGSSLVDDSCMI